MTSPGAKVNKSDLVALRNEIETAMREVGANMPYMADSFEETVDDIVTSAKTDIEAYMSDAAARAGVAKIDAPITLALSQADLDGEEN